MPNFGSSRSESSPSTLGPLAPKSYKVTPRHRQQQDKQLFESDRPNQQPVKTPQIDRQGQIDTSFVMGTVEDKPTRNRSNSHPSNPNATELLWQHQSRVGDAIVFHHLKDDGKGRLSFFRASVNLKEDLRQGVTDSEQPDVADRAVNCHFTEVPPFSQESTKIEGKSEKVENQNPLFTSHYSSNNNSSLSSSSPASNAEPSASEFGVDTPSNPSARSAISVGLGVNLLAIAVGGYLLQFSPSATEANGYGVATEQQQAQITAQALSEAVPSNSLNVTETPATIEWGQHISPIETEARQLLQQAHNQGLARDFLGALDALKQIPQGTSVHPIARSKIVEYTEKQRYKLEVEAHQLLQQAYNRAEEKDFAGAVSFVKQIPKGTIAYARVQSKLAEYSQKQRQLADTIDTASVTPTSQKRTASSQQPQRSSVVSSSLEISKPADVPTVFPSSSTSAIAQSLNPGDFLQEIAPHSVVFTFPETELGS